MRRGQVGAIVPSAHRFRDTAPPRTPRPSEAVGWPAGDCLGVGGRMAGSPDPGRQALTVRWLSAARSERFEAPAAMRSALVGSAALLLHSALHLGIHHSDTPACWNWCAGCDEPRPMARGRDDPDLAGAWLMSPPGATAESGLRKARSPGVGPPRLSGEPSGCSRLVPVSSMLTVQEPRSRLGLPSRSGRHLR